METSIQISLLVRNALVREGLKRILVDNRFDVIQSAALPDELTLDGIDNEHILILDGSFIFCDDMGALKAILEKKPGTRVVVFKDEFDFDLVSRAFATGIYAYIFQDTPLRSFLAMIQLVSLGQKIVPPELVDKLQYISPVRGHHEPVDIAVHYGLSKREKDILDCLVKGMPNKAISRQISVSEATVKLTVKGIFRKMSVTNRTQAAILAREIYEAPNDNIGEQPGDILPAPPNHLRLGEPRGPTLSS